MKPPFADGDLVRANGHSGTWIVDSLSQGRALLENIHDGRRLALPTTALSLLLHGGYQGQGDPQEEQPASATEPDLFD